MFLFSLPVSGIPRHELRVPLGMSRMDSEVPLDHSMAGALFREVPEDDEDDEEDEKEQQDDEEQDGDEGYSE